MNKTSARIDDTSMVVFLNKLEDKKFNNACLSGIREGMKILAKKTTDNFKSKRRGFRQRKVWNPRKRKMKILKVATIVVNRKVNTVKVHILADYRVKWMETGTDERTVKHWFGGWKIHSVGSVKPEYFFKRAQEEVHDQVIEKATAEITRRINRLI